MVLYLEGTTTPILALLEQIIEILVGGFTKFAQGIGDGLGAFAKAIFIVTTESGGMTLSVFGGLVIVFASIALTIGLSQFVLNWLTSLGN